MTNLNNYGIIEGRLTKEPKILANKDGSHKVFITIAAQDNFVSGPKKERATQFVNLEAFVSKDKTKSVYDSMATGDKIAVQYRVETPSYEKDGQTVYRTVLTVESVQFKESKSEKDARQAAKVAASTTTEPAEQTENADTPID